MTSADRPADPELARSLLRDCRGSIAGWIEEQGGRVFGADGDGGLAAAFEDPADAVRSALDIQDALAQRNAQVPDDGRLECRIGLASSGVAAADGDAYGGGGDQGDRLAAGLMALAEPGAILISRPVLDATRTRLRLASRSRGEHRIDGFTWPVEVYQIEGAAVTADAVAAGAAAAAVPADAQPADAAPADAAPAGPPPPGGLPEGRAGEEEKEGRQEAGAGGGRLRRAAVVAATMLLLVGLGWAAGYAYKQFAAPSRDAEDATAPVPRDEPASDGVVVVIPAPPADGEPGRPPAVAPEEPRAGPAPSPPAATAEGEGQQQPPAEATGPTETAEGPDAAAEDTAAAPAAPDAEAAAGTPGRQVGSPVDSFTEMLSDELQGAPPPPPAPADDGAGGPESALDAYFGSSASATAAQNSLAVLPFENGRGDPAWDYFSDGVTKTVIGDLSRFPHLRVIASDSVFNYKGADADPEQIGRDLGVRYVLRGSATPNGNDLLLRAELIDATTGEPVWPESYQGRFEDPSAMQQELTSRVLASLDGRDDAGGPRATVGTDEGAGAAATAAAGADGVNGETSSLRAYDQGLRWRDLFNRFNAADNERAREAALKAVELDPGYAAAYAYVAWTHLADFWWSWGQDPAAGLAAGLEWAGRAVERNPRDVDALWALGDARLAAGDLDAAVAGYERALAVNPNVAELLQDVGTWALPLVGRADEGTLLAERSMQLNPHHPEWYHGNIALNYYLLGRYGDAAEAVARMTAPRLDHRLYLAASYAQLGRGEEAKAVVDEVLAEQRDLTTEQFLATLPFKREADLQHLRSGLQRAGLPA